MNENPLGTPDEPTPDFAWPYQIAELLSEWLNDQWEDVLGQFERGLLKRRFPRLVMQAVLWSCVAYIGLVWVCLCYIQFPVSPFGLWDMVKWVAIIAIVPLIAIYILYAGGATVALLLSLLLSIAAYFTLSLCYVCWVLWGAVRKRSPWLDRYRNVVFTGLAGSLILATFVDGAYRFWDLPFEIAPWARLVLISTSAWAALFCHLVRDKAMEPAMPRAVVKWTVSLTIGLGLVALWGAGSQKDDYFLHKSVVEHPKDVGAWLDLAWHYQDKGDKIAADSGDEDHSPPDPTYLYREALDCLNHAVSLGAGGFEVHSARAQLADELGERQEAVSFGRQAPELAPASSDTSSGEEEGRVKRLSDLIAREAAVPLESDVEEHRQEHVRGRRREVLPEVVRWVFDLL
jgi:hypothetical protein